MQKIDYIKDVIKRGDKGSTRLNSICAQTLNNRNEIEIISQGIGGLAVLRIPEDYVVAVHSAGGDPKEMDLRRHTLSLIDKLAYDSENIGAEPVAFADVVDSNTGHSDMIDTVGYALKEGADKHKVGIPTGENAILGNRVNCEANVIGTMIALLPRSKAEELSSDGSLFFSFKKNGVSYAVFDPEGKPVMINSDGVGTKTEFYERSMNYKLAVDDEAAMKFDDAVKLGARVRVSSTIVETKGNIPIDEIIAHAESLGRKNNLIAIIDEDKVGNRIMGYNPCADSYNLGGSVVSTIDERRLQNPLKPTALDYLVAITAPIPNPRSNGITDKRKVMVDIFGKNWHQTEIGKIFLQYLAQPSTILYPVFNDLIDKGLATSVYHMSGGAFKGKLAKPLSKHNFFVNINDLFRPDWRESALIGHSLMPAEVAYASFPMGNDGFITTSEPKQATELIKQKYGLLARVVGPLEHSHRGWSGVRLIGIQGSNGEDVYFSGKDK